MNLFWVVRLYERENKVLLFESITQLVCLGRGVKRVTGCRIYTYTYIETHTCMRICIHKCIHMHTYIHTYTHTYMHTHMHTYICTCMHTCIHAVHIYMCSHTYSMQTTFINILIKYPVYTHMQMLCIYARVHVWMQTLSGLQIPTTAPPLPGNLAAASTA